MNRIEHPKAFISYARSTEEYKNKVLSFTTDLIKDGIDVILDLYEINLGNDLNSFMEKCVLDESITNVLMLIDENYANKANNREGGVGKETQIISEKVYKRVNESKFVPIIFGRDSKGEIVLPLYLQSRYFCDLTDPDSYSQNYKELVRALYGVNSIRKPEIGTKPAWVDEQYQPTSSTFIKLESLKKGDNFKNIESLNEFLDDLRNQILGLFNAISSISSDQEYIDLYKLFQPIRADYLLLLKNSKSIPNIEKELCSFFEKTRSKIKYNIHFYELVLIFIHELFLYTIAFFLKKKRYSAIGYILKKSYFVEDLSSSILKPFSFLFFYSGYYHSRFDSIYNSISKHNFLSPVAEYWITNFDPSCFLVSDFIAADLICCNYSVYGKSFLDSPKVWFPLLYVYDEHHFIKNLSIKMKSLEMSTEIIKIYNYDSIDEFRAKIIDVNISRREELNNIRFNSCFDLPPFLSFYIKPESIGTIP